MCNFVLNSRHIKYNFNTCQRLDCVEVFNTVGRFEVMAAMAMRVKKEAERKTVAIQVRVTAEQKRILVEAADLAGLELSTWIRTVMLKEARRLGVK